MNTTNQTKDGEEVAPEAARAIATTSSAGLFSSGVAHETPISIAPTITYGLQDTHTTILPYTFYFCVGKLAAATPTSIQIRMNSIYDMLITDLAAGTGSIGDQIAYNKFISSGIASTWVNPPRTITASTYTDEAPAYRDMWTKYYGYYSVLGCNWEVTMRNPNSNNDADACCCYFYSGNEEIPNCSLDNIVYWKGIKREIIGSGGVENTYRIRTIKGHYKPGQHKREIRDDDKAKTWTAIGAAPTLKENLNLRFYTGPLSNDVGAVAINAMVTIKYIVQFKDLHKSAQYPTFSNTSTSNADRLPPTASGAVPNTVLNWDPIS
jgi:hypothetical protein